MLEFSMAPYLVAIVKQTKKGKDKLIHECDGKGKGIVDEAPIATKNILIL
ncbi:hypothetical protein C7475_10186 [Chitinophaga sp. S165]|nr:hypothetical protein C7475_10186 [Chitinophaga sp. S165]